MFYKFSNKRYQIEPETHIKFTNGNATAETFQMYFKSVLITLQIAFETL